MDNFRLALLFSLALISLLLYQAWMQDYGGTPIAPAATDTPPVPARAPSDPLVPAPLPVADLNAPIVTTAEVRPRPAGVRVETDLLQLEISLQGGTLHDLRLLDYPVTPEQPTLKFQLFKPDLPNLYWAESGLIGANKEAAPSHETLFQSAAAHYALGAGQDVLTVDLTWSNNAGVRVIKRYTFHRGSYVIDVEQILDNATAAPWPVRPYVQLQRSDLVDPNGSSFVYTYTGAAYYSPADKYKKVAFKDITKEKLSKELSDGWIAMLQHYFVSAWIPKPGSTHTLFTHHLDGPRYVIGLYGQAVTVAPGSSQAFPERLFVGPKLQKHLAEVAPGMELTVDYGWLTVLAQPIFWLMDKLHSLMSNWGVAIILLTVLIKLAFYKLSAASYKSMAHMRKLTPRLQAMKERFGDDKDRLNQAMMELYKKEKINPLGGCLPVLVQIPVFIALYWVLLESVEMRQAPFALWITNLSAPDPYFVLPLIMGVSMFIQQKLNPAPVDPLQAKVMLSLPLVFTVFFAFFPSGLVLYWVVNNLLSIAQQWAITREIEQAAVAPHH